MKLLAGLKEDVVGWNLNGLVLQDVPSGLLGAALDVEAAEPAEVNIVPLLEGIANGLHERFHRGLHVGTFNSVFSEITTRSAFVIFLSISLADALKLNRLNSTLNGPAKVSREHTSSTPKQLHIRNMTPAHPTTERLLDWYAEHARNLPWRAAPEPYATWLSEVILQQTRVDTGGFGGFSRPFPPSRPRRRPTGSGHGSLKDSGTTAALAACAAARQIVTSGQGAMPTDAEGWRQLPGVGPYTAAAISSICFRSRFPWWMAMFSLLSRLLTS